MDKEPITLNGLNKLKEELIYLKEKKRPQIVAAIAEARSHGDLKENAEYHAAKEEQSHSEGRITEINDIIARANVIDVTKLNNDGKVIFGSTVYLEDLDTREKINYKIVGKDEADLKQKLIFFQSPISKGLIGKKDSNGNVIKKDTDFVQYLLENNDVAVVQGSAFGLEGFFRISYATSMENLKKAMEKISSFCKSLQ